MGFVVRLTTARGFPLPPPAEGLTFTKDGRVLGYYKEGDPFTIAFKREDATVFKSREDAAWAFNVHHQGGDVEDCVEDTFSVEDAIAAILAMLKPQKDALIAALKADMRVPLFRFEQGALDSMHLAKQALERAIAAYTQCSYVQGGMSAQSGLLYETLDNLDTVGAEIGAATNLAQSTIVE